MNVAYNMDCVDAMRKMPDKCFDLAVVDPPYGINRAGVKEYTGMNPKHSRVAFEDKKWDDAIPPEEYFQQLERVSANQIIWGGVTLLNICMKATKDGLCGTKGSVI